MKRTELKRKTPLCAKTSSLRRVALLRKTPLKAGNSRLRQKRSTEKPTPAQSCRWLRMRKIGCLACLINRHRPDLALRATMMVLEHHHLTSGGQRRGHDDSIELCRFHHQGDKFPMIEAGYKANAVIYGPSYGKEPRRFHQLYGTDDELLEFQNALLAVVPSQ